MEVLFPLTSTDTNLYAFEWAACTDPLRLRHAFAPARAPNFSAKREITGQIQFGHVPYPCSFAVALPLLVAAVRRENCLSKRLVRSFAQSAGILAVSPVFTGIRALDTFQMPGFRHVKCESYPLHEAHNKAHTTVVLQTQDTPTRQSDGAREHSGGFGRDEESHCVAATRSDI